MTTEELKDRLQCWRDHEPGKLDEDGFYNPTLEAIESFENNVMPYLREGHIDVVQSADGGIVAYLDRKNHATIEVFDTGEVNMAIFSNENGLAFFQKIKIIPDD